jgi:hypothetical protein
MGAGDEHQQGHRDFQLSLADAAVRAVLVLLNRQNRSISLFQPHFRTQNRFTLLLEML